MAASGLSRGGRESDAKAGGVGEFELLAKVRSAVARLGLGSGVVVGIGDDCAVVRGPVVARGASRGATPLQVLTTDTMVEGVHFRAGWLTPRELGVRAFRAAVSDVAAMGGRARYVLLSLELAVGAGGFDEKGALAVGAGGFDVKDALALVRGVAADARRAGATLVGGNVSGAVRTGVTVTVVGETRGKPLLRSGARAGDLVFVTGALGGAAAGVLALSKSEAAGVLGLSNASDSRGGALTSAYRRPPLRLAFAAELGERGLAHAMVDVSDGLLQDLGHVASASRVVLRIDPGAVPVHRAARLLELEPGAARGFRARSAGLENARRSDAGAAHELALRRHAGTAHELELRRNAASALELALGGGEDYELAFTAAPASRPAIERLAQKHRVPLAVIGSVVRGRPGVVGNDGRPFATTLAGFDHLRRPGRRETKRG